LIEEGGLSQQNLIAGLEEVACGGVAVDAQGVAPHVLDEVAAVLKRHLGLDTGDMGLRDDDVAFRRPADQKAVAPCFKAAIRIVFLDQSEGAVHTDTPSQLLPQIYLF
jgi:hypothetical protein